MATAVVLFRDGPRGREVFLVRRGLDRRFAAGFHAFPGGRLDPEDAEIEVPGLAGEEAALAACAARELFEETGVLFARGPAPSPDGARLGRGAPCSRARSRSAGSSSASGSSWIRRRSRPPAAG